MIVMEFDETTVGSRDALLHLASAVRGQVHRNPLIIVSAASRLTDLLLHAAHSAATRKAFEPAWTRLVSCQGALIEDVGLPCDFSRDDLRAIHSLLCEISAVRRVSPRTLDLVVSHGERMAARVVAEFLTIGGIRATPRMAGDMGLQTDSCFGAARPAQDSPHRMRAAWEASVAQLVVTAGCVGKDRSGAVTRLGHGGGELSAALFGVALQAEELQLWTHASRGMETARRLVKAARVLSGLLLAHGADRALPGTHFLDMDSVERAHRPTIPVRVMDTFAPEDPGIQVTPPGFTNAGVRGEARTPSLPPDLPSPGPHPAAPRLVPYAAGLSHAGRMAR